MNKIIQRIAVECMILIFSVVLISCWHPPFDPELSASVFTIKKLGEPVWEATIQLYSGTHNGYYLPSRLDYLKGMWIEEAEQAIKVGFVQSDMSSNKINGDISQFTIKNDMHNQRVLLQTLQGQVAYIASNETSGFVRIQSNYFKKEKTFTSPCGYGWAPAITTDPYSQAGDTLFAAELDSSILTISTCTVMGTESEFSFSDKGSYSFSVGETPKTPFFVTQSPVTEDFYLSAYFSDGLRTYRWEPSSENESFTQLPIHQPLTGVLSDGRLLAATDSKLYVYSPDGSKCITIFTGVLKFVGEKYDVANGWICVFCRTVGIPPRDKDQWEYQIDIYEIPTSKLDTLEK